jgi:hypothetical protein
LPLLKNINQRAANISTVFCRKPQENFTCAQFKVVGVDIFFTILSQEIVWPEDIALKDNLFHTFSCIIVVTFAWAHVWHSSLTTSYLKI